MLVRSQLSSLRWVRLDREAGELVIERKVGFRRQPCTDRACPLKAIQAVQLLYSGRHSVTRPEGYGEQQTISYREFFGYELNLVLDDPPGATAESLQSLRLAVDPANRSIDGGLPCGAGIDKLHHDG